MLVEVQLKNNLMYLHESKDTNEQNKLQLYMALHGSLKLHFKVSKDKERGGKELNPPKRN